MERLERDRQLKARRAEEERAKRLSFEIPKKYPLGLADPANNALLKAAQNAHIKDPVKAAAKAIAERLVNFLPLPTPPRSAALLPIHPRLLTPAPALQALLGAVKLPPLPNRYVSRHVHCGASTQSPCFFFFWIRPNGQGNMSKMLKNIMTEWTPNSVENSDL